MIVEFHRADEKHYGMVVLREDYPNLDMIYGPGFDRLMPHDMLHFIVEQEFGLNNAIFGQVAAGGTAGTFLQNPSEAQNTKDNQRQLRKIKERGKKMLKDGIDECAQSERATYICWQNWLAHSENPKLREKAAEMEDTAQSIFGQMTPSERERYTKSKLVSVRKRMDEVSQKWSALRVGEFLSLEW